MQIDIYNETSKQIKQLCVQKRGKQGKQSNVPNTKAKTYRMTSSASFQRKNALIDRRRTNVVHSHTNRLLVGTYLFLYMYCPLPKMIMNSLAFVFKNNNELWEVMTDGKDGSFIIVLVASMIV